MTNPQNFRSFEEWSSSLTDREILEYVLRYAAQTRSELMRLKDRIDEMEKKAEALASPDALMGLMDKFMSGNGMLGMLGKR